MATEQKQEIMTLAQASERITQLVLSELGIKEKSGLVLPDGYLAENAIMSAMFQIKNTLDTNKQPVLKTCKPESIKQSLWDMVSKGLDPNKKHCYWIAYGDQLSMTESYFGLVFRTKRADKNIEDIFAEVVYEGDKFEYVISRGAKKVTKHEQSPDNVDMNKIKGVYATIYYKDGKEVSEYMTMAQVRTSWAKSKTGGGVHKDFPDMMAKRSVVKRLANMTLNTDTNIPLLNEQFADDFDQEAGASEATEMLDITPPTKEIAETKESLPFEQTSIEEVPDLFK